MAIEMGFLMQATDSVTGNIYYWTATSPDWTGDNYPGPNLPTDIAKSANNITSMDIDVDFPYDPLEPWE